MAIVSITNAEDIIDIKMSPVNTNYKLGGKADVSDFVNAESIDFSGNNITSIGGLERIRLVENLDVSNNLIDQDLPDLSHMNALTSLDLSNNKFEGQIPALSSNPNLGSIDAEDNEFTGLDGFGVPQTLVSANFRDNKFRQDAVDKTLRIFNSSTTQGGPTGTLNLKGPNMGVPTGGVFNQDYLDLLDKGWNVTAQFHTIPDGSMTFSLRDLYDTGKSVIRLRRTGDDGEKDFNGNDIDTSEYVKWTMGETETIHQDETVFYDKSVYSLRQVNPLFDREVIFVTRGDGVSGAVLFDPTANKVTEQSVVRLGQGLSTSLHEFAKSSNDPVLTNTHPENSSTVAANLSSSSTPSDFGIEIPQSTSITYHLAETSVNKTRYKTHHDPGTYVIEFKARLESIFSDSSLNSPSKTSTAIGELKLHIGASVQSVVAGQNRFEIPLYSSGEISLKKSSGEQLNVRIFDLKITREISSVYIRTWYDQYGGRYLQSTEHNGVLVRPQIVDYAGKVLVDDNGNARAKMEYGGILENSGSYNSPSKFPFFDETGSASQLHMVVQEAQDRNYLTYGTSMNIMRIGDHLDPENTTAGQINVKFGELTTLNGNESDVYTKNYGGGTVILDPVSAPVLLTIEKTYNATPANSTYRLLENGLERISAFTDGTASGVVSDGIRIGDHFLSDNSSGITSSSFYVSEIYLSQQPLTESYKIRSHINNHYKLYNHVGAGVFAATSGHISPNYSINNPSTSGFIMDGGNLSNNTAIFRGTSEAGNQNEIATADFRLERDLKANQKVRVKMDFSNTQPDSPSSAFISLCKPILDSSKEFDLVYDRNKFVSGDINTTDGLEDGNGSRLSIESTYTHSNSTVYKNILKFTQDGTAAYFSLKLNNPNYVASESGYVRFTVINDTGLTGYWGLGVGIFAPFVDSRVAVTAGLQTVTLLYGNAYNDLSQSVKTSTDFFINIVNNASGTPTSLPVPANGKVIRFIKIEVGTQSALDSLEEVRGSAKLVRSPALGGETNYLKFKPDNGTNTNYNFGIANIGNTGSIFSLTGKAFVPSSQSVIKGIEIRSGNSGGSTLLASGYQLFTSSKGSWHNFAIDNMTIPSGQGLYIFLHDGTDSTITIGGGTTNKYLAFKDLLLTERGDGVGANTRVALTTGSLDMYLTPTVSGVDRIRIEEDNEKIDFQIRNFNVQTVFNDAFVRKWYNQTDLGTDAEQATSGNQPQIISDNKPISVNSKPAISSVNNTKSLVIPQRYDLGTTGHLFYYHVGQMENATIPTDSTSPYDTTMKIFRATNSKSSYTQQPLAFYRTRSASGAQLSQLQTSIHIGATSANNANANINIDTNPKIQHLAMLDTKKEGNNTAIAEYRVFDDTTDVSLTTPITLTSSSDIAPSADAQIFINEAPDDVSFFLQELVHIPRDINRRQLGNIKDEVIDYYGISDQTKGPWKKVFRHNITNATGTSYSADPANWWNNATGWKEIRDGFNKNNPGADKFSAMDEVANYQIGGTYTFKLYYPEIGEEFIWSQTVNPVTMPLNSPSASGDTGTVVVKKFSPGVLTRAQWQGLGPETSDASTWLDGKLGSGNWYYAVGQFQRWNDNYKIAGPYLGTADGRFTQGTDAIKIVELYIKRA